MQVFKEHWRRKRLLVFVWIVETSLEIRAWHEQMNFQVLQEKGNSTKWIQLRQLVHSRPVSTNST